MSLFFAWTIFRFLKHHVARVWRITHYYAMLAMPQNSTIMLLKCNDYAQIMLWLLCNKLHTTNNKTTNHTAIPTRQVKNVNLRFINPIRAPSAPPNVCDICDRKLWLSVGGAFYQLLAQSGYKRKLPWARNLISQCC